MSSDHETSDSECEEVDQAQDLSNSDVTTKYRAAGTIVNAALDSVVTECKLGADIVGICKKGDEIIVEQTSKIYNKKEKGEKIEKGVAFPTCISVNEICGHFSPLENESYVLKEGDLVKIDMGCHIDGYIAVAGHSIVVLNEEEQLNEVTGRKADVLKASWTAAEAALRMVKVGNTNLQVTKVIELACDEFKCTPVQGVRSHQMKRFIIDCNQCIASRDTPDERSDEFEFAPNEVYGIDIVVSSGDGKRKDADKRTTVYKRAVETKFILRTALARSFIAEVNKRFPTLPFTIRSISDERACRLGVSECMRHELLHPFPVTTEKAGEFVAQFKFTVLLLPGGTKRITGLQITQPIASEHSVANEELKQLLATSADPKTTKRRAKASARKQAACSGDTNSHNGNMDPP